MSAPNNSNPTRAPNVAEKRLAETIDNIYSGNPQQHAFGKDGVAITEDAKNIRKEFDDFNKNATGVEKKQTPSTQSNLSLGESSNAAGSSKNQGANSTGTEGAGSSIKTGYSISDLVD
ncbi:hypothetical protein PTNB73_04924 [Pyrenophora teres f. teres]|uniref:Uncharacterized protein n=1 Tax=Pyrenophora teres f. teres TaxID=97479 RepID=A0A6S6W293_9PLEO|nr:hypothetical protein HRS9139_05515 [Pyrenophora teres f. teres]KAE8840534.1 hypothetical protein PTNB85_03933 [Pyrenophora teres f. teres]KAE8864033.1 hypothetical protein PTNB29_03997 [Pyrenophora teres f. teres]KAE8866830.1 hypothetical protein PTNB73_04924 [Pyrenophora teres f. teres]CAE7033078.1 hypothetical protein PTTW11_05136 [Pyrenophora teres f. teres]